MERAFELGVAYKGLVDVTDLREFPEVGQWYSRCYNSVPGFSAFLSFLLLFLLCETIELDESKCLTPFYTCLIASSIVQLAKILDNCYPERIRVVILIGAPSVFQLVWSMFQRVIPAETKKKIKMFGPNQEKQWVQELEKHISPALVPRYLGGECFFF